MKVRNGIISSKINNMEWFASKMFSCSEHPATQQDSTPLAGQKYLMMDFRSGFL